MYPSAYIRFLLMFLIPLVAATTSISNASINLGSARLTYEDSIDFSPTERHCSSETPIIPTHLQLLSRTSKVMVDHVVFKYSSGFEQKIIVRRTLQRGRTSAWLSFEGLEDCIVGLRIHGFNLQPETSFPRIHLRIK